MKSNNLIYGELSYELVRILFKVHNELGRFRNEKEYCDKIEFYLKEEKIKYVREKVIPVSFEGEKSGRNRVDFEIEEKILFDAKTVRVLDREEYYQMQRYLVSAKMKLGILANFREKFLKPRRILNSLAKISN